LGLSEFNDRIDIACDHLRNGKLKCASRASDILHSAVALMDFAAWARSLGWELPDQFPIADAVVSRDPAPDDQGAPNWIPFAEAVKAAWKILYAEKWVGSPSSHENDVH
jgi:hypothetical protein